MLIGYTTGVFDLFHIGHLKILEKSKEYCDYLIVGVSTDELVREYKNKTPVIPFHERIEIVQAIKYVDKTIPQVSLDKYNAWKELRFDIIFHGDDWKNSKMFNDCEKKLTGKGVKFVYFPYTKGISSSIITEALKSVRGETKS